MSEEKNSIQKAYQNLSLKKEESKVVMTAEVPVDILERAFEKALTRAVSEVVFDGFRKGHAPREQVRARVGDAVLLEEAAEHVVGEAYAHIIRDEKLDVIGRPTVRVTKMAKGNPLAFSVEVGLLPQFTLPAYHDLAQEVIKAHPLKEEEVSEEEVDAEVRRLRDMLEDALEKGEGHEHEHDHANESHEHVTEEKEHHIAIDDAFAQSIGEYKTLADLKEVIRVGLKSKKSQKAHSARRIALVEALLAKTPIALPEVLVESELHSMRAEFEGRLERAGLTFEAYCTQEKKTEENIFHEWRPDAEKRARTQLLLNAIAEKEKLIPETERFEREVAHLKEHYPDAREENIQTFVATNMINEMVFALLEGEKKV